MRRQSLVWQLYWTYLMVSLLALAVVWLVASGSVRRFFVQETARELEARAHLVREQVVEMLLRDDRQGLSEYCNRVTEHTGTRITVVLAGGQVVGDSDEDPKGMELHTGRARPEIREAFEGRLGRARHYSPTLQRTMMYVAVPVFLPGRPSTEVAAVVRTAVPITAVNSALRDIRIELGAAAFSVAVLFALISFLASRRIARPLDDLRKGAERFASGDLHRPVPLPEVAEIRVLAETLNRMAVELDQRIRTVTRQRNEQEAILFSMVEGVLAVDTGRRVVIMNEAFGRMLQIDPRRSQGEEIHETLRTPELLSLLEQALKEPRSVEGEVSLMTLGEQRFFQVHGAPLRDAQGVQIGAVLVLNDHTRLHRLERIRRDFVANVSHELKTPITSIKVATETLEEGAAQDREKADHFLRIIARHTDRLHAIIEDLLSLSRLEQESEVRSIVLTRGELAPVLVRAVQACELKAEEKQITLVSRCDPRLQARINAPLLETALVNLIDNAVKYSERGTTVTLEAVYGNGEVVLSVTDQGSGIEAEHLPRIFERFYRVDRARSRNLGGTGLGLAIVKHIANAHGGAVQVESEPGVGSTFRLYLPGA